MDIVKFAAGVVIGAIIGGALWRFIIWLFEQILK